MNRRDAILAKDAKAIAWAFDLWRVNGWTYVRCCEQLRKIFEEVGREPPSDAEIDAMLREADEGY